MKKFLHLFVIGGLAANLVSCSEPMNNSNAAAPAHADVGAGSNVPALPIEKMTGLLNKMETWNELSPLEKEGAIKTIFDLFRNRENSAITKSAKFYADRVDAALTENPTFLNASLPSLVKILAVMEYDFYNGQNKETLAQQVLGDKLYESNRKRLEQEGRPPSP